MGKILFVDPELCTGCRTCELFCAVSHTGSTNPLRSRIRIVKFFNDMVNIPMVCRHCEDAPCAKACPKGAIYRDEELSRVMIDYSLCIGCKTCMQVCPFGAISFDPEEKKVFKCDLCGGDPLCVAVCDTKAIDFIDEKEASLRTKLYEAEHIKESIEKGHTAG